MRRYPGVAVFSKARMTVLLEIAISDFGSGIFRPSGRPGSTAGGTHGVHASLEGSISSKCAFFRFYTEHKLMSRVVDIAPKADQRVVLE